MELTDMDLELLELTSVPLDALKVCKNYSNSPLLQYYGFSEEYWDYVPVDGVCIDLGKNKCSGSKIKDAVDKVNKALVLANTGCLCFASELYIELAESNDCIAIIKAEDDFEILRQAGTMGLDEGVTTEQIIKKLSIWKKISRCDFKIVYADMQSMEATFTKMPPNLRRFALRINTFTPALIERLEGGIQEYINIMDTDNIFTLAWD